MITLQHAIRITAPRERIYQALTDVAVMREWHPAMIEGGLSPTEQVTFVREDGARSCWKVKSVERNTGAVWAQMSGTGYLPGKTVTIHIVEAGDGAVQVDLTDGAWSDADSDLAVSNTYWGFVLHRLKRYAEYAA